MATTEEVIYTLGFADDTTKKVSVGPFAAGHVSNAIKSRVMDFNSNFTTDTGRTILSKYGNQWTGITAVQLVTTAKTTFF